MKCVGQFTMYINLSNDVLIRIAKLNNALTDDHDIFLIVPDNKVQSTRRVEHLEPA